MKKRLIVVPSSFQQCLEPVNVLITEWFFEAKPFRRLRQLIILEITRRGYSSFFSKGSKLHANFRNAIENHENVFCF